MTIRTQADSTKATNPHDEFAKSVFRELPQARGLFCSYLPSRIAGLFDWQSLRLERDAFSTKELVGEYADLLFSVQIKGSKLRQRIRLLFEHKRRPDKETPRQLMRYINRQFEQTPSKKPLPCIITVLLLQNGRCPKPTFSSEYQLPDEILVELSRFMVDFQMVTIELSQLDEAQLLGTAFGRFALAAMKSVGEGHPERLLDFETILRDLYENLPSAQTEEEIDRGAYYVTTTADTAQEQILRERILASKKAFAPLEEHVMTMMEAIEKRGEQRGEARGVQLGKRLARIEFVIRLLSRMFSEFTEAEAHQLNDLTDSKVEEIMDAALSQQDWSEIRKLFRSSRSRTPKKNATQKR